ncbi:cilia- and flagella-associated protein 157 [Musca vetustissima]|uniref:cilia- and flagella-associated protein 157 n=1 Tax=Musca vetustissima TaxID=27455 RepID=UPI002AB75D03|nr:cilia- and flagella-associated protein 157 [Musca vetustissima]
MGKKGKKEKKPKDDPNKLTQVDRTFYELTITDLNQKLARLRSHLVTLDENNVNLKEQLKNITEERTDVAAHLERTLAERDDTITELEERLVEITKVRNKEKSEAAEQIRDLEAKYKAMHDQLTSEIKLLNGKLNSLDEFRIQRDVLMAKFDDQEAEAKERERLHQELIYSMEQKAVVEKDALKREVEAKLLQVSEDFTRSSEIRNAGYTRRLIRENIALQKEIDSLVLSQIRMQQEFNDTMAKHKEMTEQFTALEQLKNELIRSNQNKIKIIEKLTSNYERLKAKHVELLKYRNLYENLAKRDVCERFTINDMSKKMKIMSQRIESLKMEKQRLHAQHERYEEEIKRLKGVQQQIRNAIQQAITSMTGQSRTTDHDLKAADQEEDGGSMVAIKKLQRQDLLHELLEIISSQTEDPQSQDNTPGTPSSHTDSQSKPSIYRPGKMGFMTRSTSSLMEIFKRDVHRLVSAEIIATAYQTKKEEGKIIPKERVSEAGSIIDVQMGSTLYVSESHDEMDVVAEADEEPEDMGEEVSSSSEYGPEAGQEQRKSTRESLMMASPRDSDKEAGTSAGGGGGVMPSTSESLSRGSRVSRMSRQKSLPQADDEAYSINLFY